MIINDRAQQTKVPAAKHEGLRQSPVHTRWKKRTDLQQLSSDVHLPVAHGFPTPTKQRECNKHLSNKYYYLTEPGAVAHVCHPNTLEAYTLSQKETKLYKIKQKVVHLNFNFSKDRQLTTPQVTQYDLDNFHIKNLFCSILKDVSYNFPFCRYLACIANHTELFKCGFYIIQTFKYQKIICQPLRVPSSVSQPSVTSYPSFLKPGSLQRHR